MISTQDFLNLTLGFGFLVFVGFFSYMAYQVAQTFKAIRRIAENFETATDGVKLGILGIVRNILGRRWGYGKI